jgi:hypothetical protein
LKVLTVPQTPKIPNNNKKAELPPVGQKVMVQCEGYRGLAYRDDSGVWKNAGNNKNLPKDVEILPLK